MKTSGLGVRQWPRCARACACAARARQLANVRHVRQRTDTRRLTMTGPAVFVVVVLIGHGGLYYQPCRTDKANGFTVSLSLSPPSPFNVQPTLH